MNFDFSNEQKMLKDQARKFLQDQCSSTVVRQVLEGEMEYASHVWQEMAQMGWQGTCIPEAYGGAGLGYLELCVLAEEVGRSLAPIPFSSSVYLAAEALLSAGSEAQKSHWLPKLSSGEAIGVLALAEGAGAPVESHLQCQFSGGQLTGKKMPVLDGPLADVAIVVAKDGETGGVSLVLVDVADSSVQTEPLTTVDPTRPQAIMTFNNTPAECLGAPGKGWGLLTQLFNKAAVLLAFEQIGGADAALQMARDYALGRYAFGRQIGSFQAIKHKLADCYIKNELARSNTYFGAWALSTNARELPLAAATARVSAIQAFEFAAKENIQTHGGMGYTWEFDCHLYYRRAKLLALSLGSALTWKNRLVDQLEQPSAA